MADDAYFMNQGMEMEDHDMEETHAEEHNGEHNTGEQSTRNNDGADIDFSQLDDEGWRRQEMEDDRNILRALDPVDQGAQEGEDTGPGLFDPNRPLDLGEKADDAQDFEDFDDDDLPEEEEAAPALTDDMDMDDEDDLFGEGPVTSSSEPPEHSQTVYTSGDAEQVEIQDESPSEQDEVQKLRALNFPEEHDPKLKNVTEEIARELYPEFRQHVTFNFTDMFPPRRAEFQPKAPLKPPKPLNPTKVSLDIAPDQEKTFRTAGPSVGDKRKRVAEAEAKGLIAILEESSDEGDEEDVFDYSYPSDTVGGKTLMDLEVICADWDSILNRLPEDPIEELEDEPMDDWEREMYGNRPARKKTTAPVEENVIDAPHYPVPSFDNFEEMAAQTAKRVVLDLNDPHLLVDITEPDPAAKRRRIGPAGNFKRTGSTFASALTRRFNISNDEAYDALKENHQSKVRATLGNFTVEHSMPALKLQWPYYRVKLFVKDARSYHRPTLKFNRFVGQNIHFTKPGMRKRKAVKNMPTHELFKSTEDLSLKEFYSTATLLEYCEEHPAVLSNFGMGNRIINYYRRKNAEDTDRPMPEDKVGDTQVLLPEDRSPFANFGIVEPGEVTRTIHNGMYRAPIFKHEPKKTDFLVIRSSTGVGGSSWHIRNIDNLFVVGQQFPSIEIPTPHSRKVTNAARSRIRMISYRLMRKNPNNPALRIDDITRHIPDSTEPQNRQKLKEFLQYDKTEKLWRMREKETPPDETFIRSMVKPEDVCVIDAMQVGARHMEDAGYEVVRKENENNDGDENENLKEGKKLAESLTPWETSAAFLESTTEKAMCDLHGAGDPTGRGLAFSFVRTSMKGGYLGSLQGSSAPKPKKDTTGAAHSYNVKEQSTLYNEAIKKIWNAQKSNLSDPVEHEEDPIPRDEDDDDRPGVSQTPRHPATPAAFDDNASMLTTRSGNEKVMHIRRTFRNQWGEVEEVLEVVKDPRVWRQYEKRRRQIDAETTKLEDLVPTGNQDMDAAGIELIQEELQRLNRNKERRLAREKSKIGGGKTGRGRKAVAQLPEPENPGSPSSVIAQSIEKPTGTTRKCANCGQTGHIKTNKKLCPMLNGTMKQEDLATNHGGFGAIQPPSFA